jgi:hypothetical protein
MPTLRQKSIFAVMVLSLSPAAMASTPNECVALVNLPKGGAALKNICDRKVNLYYCVDNPESQYRCRAGSVGGAAETVLPGFQKGIPDYGAQGGGEVKFFACFDPRHPRDWDMIKNTASCR